MPNLINRIGSWRSWALIPCLSWWKISPIAPKDHMHAKTCHKNIEAKALEAGTPRSIDKTFLMRKRRDCYYQKWMNKLQKRSIPIKGDQNPNR